MCWSEWFHYLTTRYLKEFSERPPMACLIQRLPNELLIIIFHHVVSSSRPPKSVSSLTHVQTLLSQVSKQWNSIILSTPSLWTHVPIVPFQSAHVLRSFLQNSLSLPISVTVHPWPVVLKHTAINSLDMQLHTLLEARRDCERITSLRIEATGLDDLVDRVLHTWTEACGDWKMLALEGIYLKGESHTVWDGSQFFSRAIAPALRTLVVEDMPLGWFQGLDKRSSPLGVTTLVWKHSPAFGSVSTLEFAQLVSAFPSVTTVQLAGPVVDFEAQRCLESRFGASGPCSPLYFLKAEGVTSLRITDGSEMPVSPMDPFHLFRSSSSTFDLAATATRAIPTTTQSGSSAPQFVSVQPGNINCEIIY